MINAVASGLGIGQDHRGKINTADTLIGVALLIIAALGIAGMIPMGSNIVPYVLVGLGGLQVCRFVQSAIASALSKMKELCQGSGSNSAITFG